MRQLWLVAILLAGVAVVTAVSPLSGWQLTGNARVPPGAPVLATVELPRSVMATVPLPAYPQGRAGALPGHHVELLVMQPVVRLDGQRAPQ
ncbi:MAG: hypothetical protein F4Z04_06465 [Acidobacteria bacterium]|nr:hypothetical protein [Acidobacteriota bacterium]